jgi:hypothetical protein
MNDLNFDFSLDNDGVWEDIDNRIKCEHDECITLLGTLVEKKKFILGERTEGNVDITNGVITLEYKRCIEVGKDWNDDVWEDEKSEFPVSDIE